MKSWLVIVCLWATVYADPDTIYGAPVTYPAPGPQISPPIQPSPCSVYVCPPPPPEPIPPPPQPKIGLITSLLHFMDSINVGANTLISKTFKENVEEITGLINTVGITGDICSVLRRNKKLGEDFWKLILNTISDLAWKLEKLVVAAGIIYEEQLGLILGDPAVQDDIRTFHGLLGAGQGKAVPIVLAVKAAFDQTLAQFDLQTRILYSTARRDCPKAAQKRWVALYQQTVVSLGKIMEKYFTQTQVTAVATQNQLKALVARLLTKEVAAVTQILS